jgi:hypothetical protein
LDEDDVVLGIEVIGRFIKRFGHVSALFVMAFEFCKNFFAGSLKVLRGKMPLGESSDIDIDLMDSFVELLAVLIGLKTGLVDDIAKFAMGLMNRREERYRDMGLSVFISGLEAGTLSLDTVKTIIRMLPELVTLATHISQQNCCYALSVILQKHPDFIGGILELLPVIVDWWRKNLGSGDGLDRMSNFASLFLFLRAEFGETSLVCNDLLLEVLDYYPPCDRSEAAFMSKNLVKLLDNCDDFEVKVKVAARVVGMLVENSKVLRKMKVDDEVINALHVLLKRLCEEEQVKNGVISEYSEEVLLRIDGLIN